MPFDSDFCQAIEATLVNAGRTVTYPNAMPNPLPLEIGYEGKFERLLIHARRLTHQSSQTSTHNRPIGEMHLQMIFDGDIRGAGNKCVLRHKQSHRSVLFGFSEISDNNYIVAAFDPSKHMEYSYSASLQVKYRAIEQAMRSGIGFHQKKNDETVVIFQLSELEQYLLFALEFHTFTYQSTNSIITDETPTYIKASLIDAEDGEMLPELTGQERKRTIAVVGRYLRDKNFERAIKLVYPRCALCDFQYDNILDAAHIVPVAEGGEDTYANGIGLCPNCHRMYDKGFVLIDGTGKISINIRYSKLYVSAGMAGSLETLQSTLREYIWMPEKEEYQPSSNNLQRIYDKRK